MKHSYSYQTKENETVMRDNLTKGNENNNDGSMKPFRNKLFTNENGRDPAEQNFNTLTH